MTQLTIPLAELRRLAGIDAADTSQDTALAALQTAEQAAAEYMLDPIALAAAASDDGLRATLTLGVAETLAGSFLSQQARAPGAADGVKIGDLTLNPASAGSNNAAEALRQQGAARLKPFGRPVIAPVVGGVGAGQSLADASDEGPLVAPIAASVFDCGCADAVPSACDGGPV